MWAGSRDSSRPSGIRSKCGKWIEGRSALGVAPDGPAIHHLARHDGIDLYTARAGSDEERSRLRELERVLAERNQVVRPVVVELGAGPPAVLSIHGRFGSTRRRLDVDTAAPSPDALDRICGLMIRGRERHEVDPGLLFEPALDREAQGMAQLFGSPVNRALLNVFFLTDRNKKDRGVADPGVAPAANARRQALAEVSYFKTKNGTNNMIYMQGARKLTDWDKNLLEIFCGNIAVALDNIYLIDRIVQKEIEAERSRMETEKACEALSRYVSPQIAGDILLKGINFTGERKRATIMFFDLRNFTALSDKMRAEEVVALLNQFFSEFVDIIFEHTGTLDKFLGDGLMAVFGVPLGTGSDELNAVWLLCEYGKPSGRSIASGFWRANSQFNSASAFTPAPLNFYSPHCRYIDNSRSYRFDNLRCCMPHFCKDID